MGASRRRKSTSVADQLFQEPYRFDFFQAVRLLEAMGREQHAREQLAPRRPVGHDWPPVREVARFRALVSLTYPPSSLSALKPPAEDPDREPDDTPPADMTVAFMGLTGPSGVLPSHYTSLLLERCHIKTKDYALRDFFDLFNHRSISFFYRAWEKYRFPFAYERNKLDPAPEEEDLFTYVVRCLVGLGTQGLSDQLSVDDEALFHYAGHFAHDPRNAISLEALLGDYFELPLTVNQFEGQWLYLQESEQSCFPGGAKYPYGLNMSLGQDAMLGQRVWSIESKVRVQVGPLSYTDFLSFMPIGHRLLPMCQLVRLYIRSQFDFDVQPVLKKEEVPAIQLVPAGDTGPRLGWNTWLKSVPYPRDADDAVFALDVG